MKILGAWFDTEEESTDESEEIHNGFRVNKNNVRRNKTSGAHFLFTSLSLT